MGSTHAHPAQFAQVVRAQLVERGVATPALPVLVELFELMYFTSLRTEEGHPLRFRIAWMDDANAMDDPSGPLYPADRWSCIPLAQPIPLTAENVKKIALASDPRTSALAIRFRNDQLEIWALTDQGNRYYDYLNYEAEALPDRPGTFQASVRSTGHLVAYIGTERIAELKIDQLMQRPIDVFSAGPIRDALQPPIDQFIESIEQRLGDTRSWHDKLAGYWISGLCRLLMRIDSYHHGGALLITPHRVHPQLAPRFEITYDRLASSLQERAVTSIRRHRVAEQIHEHWVAGHDIPSDQYADHLTSTTLLSEIQSEIDGALWFVSLLSRVDGLVQLAPDLGVHAFGVEITTSDEPSTVVRAQDNLATDVTPFEFDHFGTRHRSMMRYCNAHPEAVGFVISQDRKIRAMCKVDGNLVVWDRVKLQRPMSQAEEDDPGLEDDHAITADVGDE